MRATSISLLALVLLSGCAAITDGTTQTVTIRTAPVGGTCSVQRDGAVLATILATPATLVVQRERADLTVVCQKAGWDTTVATLPSRFTGVTAGNFLIGGLIGVVVDEATQANYRYEEDKTILLNPPGSSRMLSGPNVYVPAHVSPAQPASPQRSSTSAVILGGMDATPSDG